MAFIWLIAAFLIPTIVAFQDGSTYTFAFSVSVVGVVLYFLNVFLIRSYVGRHNPTLIDSDEWEDTAGTGVVPKWVSLIGLIGMGFIPSGLVVALLLWFDVVVNHS